MARYYTITFYNRDSFINDKPTIQSIIGGIPLVAEDIEHAHKLAEIERRKLCVFFKCLDHEVFTEIHEDNSE